MLSYIIREKFASQSDFISKFGDLVDASQVAKLHAVLKPFLLRRIKEDVERSLPPKEEVSNSHTLIAFLHTYILTHILSRTIFPHTCLLTHTHPSYTQSHSYP